MAIKFNSLDPKTQATIQRVRDNPELYAKLTPKIEKLYQEIATIHPTVNPALEAAIEEIGKAGVKKFKTSIRLDMDVYEWLQSESGWQGRLNKALRAMMEASK